MRTVRLLNKKKTFDAVIARTEAIVVGNTYFKSNFYDKHGSWVVVTGKSTKINGAGWPSSVSYRVIERVGTDSSHTDEPGYEGTCNACNLYTRTIDAACYNDKVAAGLI